MIRLNLCVLFSIVGASLPVASQTLDWRSGCEFRDLLAEEVFRSLQRGAAIEAQTKPILAALDKILEKAPNSSVPLDRQLGATDVAEFNKKRDELAKFQALQLVERRRQRDVQVIGKMIGWADQSYRYGLEPAKDGRSDELIFGSLRAIRDAGLGQVTDLTSLPKDCSLAASISLIKVEVFAKAARYDLQRVKELGDELRKKYSIDGAIDRDRLNKEDQDLWDGVVKNIVIPAARAKDFLLDLDATLVALEASDTLYALDKDDIDKFGGDVEKIGSSVKARAENGEFDDPMITAIGIWRLGNENSQFR